MALQHYGKEHQAREQHQLDKATLNFGLNNRKPTFEEDYPFVFEGQFDLIKANVIGGNLVEKLA